MFLSKAVFRTAVLLVILCVALSTSSSSSSCPLACLCERGPHINCSSLGLQEVPLQIPETVTSLNLSHNALRTLPPLWPGHRIVGGLQYLWLDHNKMETFSLCTRRDRNRLKTLTAESCESWAPGLEQLSVVKNRIHQVPRGLRGSANLRVLQLSHNKISTLSLLDFQGCRHLRELHLQGNLISTIHPLAFKDMQELQVLDLRFNLLTTIPSPVYLSLLNLRTQVDLSNNRWRCDCSLRGIHHRLMQMDLDQISQPWRMICSSPLRLAGQELMQLQDQDLICPPLGHGHVEHFDEVAEEGTQILLPCGSKNQDCSQALWWTPQGQATGTQHGLLLTDITDRDAGLYVCVSGQQEELVSVFDLHVDLHKAAGTRLKRAVDHADSRIVEEGSKRNQVKALKTQSEFDLAVGLSVFFTFIIAFIIGVLVRPCLDTLWTKLRARRSSSDPPSPQVVVTTQHPAEYNNEGFAMSEEPGQVRVGHRVTFAEATEPTYIIPVDDNNDTSSESSVEKEPVYENSAQNSVTVENLETQQQSSRKAEQQESEASGTNTVMYEPIPDPKEFKMDTSSISSASSISDQDQESPDSAYENIPTTVRKTKGGELEVNKTLEQTTNQQNSSSPEERPVVVPEPYTDWATKLWEKNKEQTNPLDPELWNDSGESFSFTDGSERSSTRDKSHSQASTQPAAETGVLRPEDSDDDVALLELKPRERQAYEDEVPDEPIYEEISRPSTSTDSVDSENEPTEYTVNPDEEEDEEEEKTLGPTITENVIPLQSDTRIDSTGQDRLFSNRHRVDTILLEPDDIKFTIIHDSSDPGAMDEDPFFSEEAPSHQIRPQWQNYPPRRDKFSSSEGEEEPKKYNVHPVYRKRPIIHSTSDSYSERASLSSEDEEESPSYWPHTSIKNRADIESRPITIDTSSLSVTTNLLINRPDRINIDFDNSATNTDEFETGNSSGPRSPFQIEETIRGVSLDQVILPKRALIFGVKNTEDHKQVPLTDQRPSLSSVSGTVVRPGLIGSQLSSHSRPSLSSQSSVSSDENDNTATITEIIGKNNSVSGSPKPPPFRTEGTVRGPSKDKRQTSEFRPRVSSLGSLSSDENDFSVTNTDISNKSNSVSGSHRRAPSPPPFRMEGTMERISLDQIPYPNRALIFGVRNSLDHMQVAVTSQRQPSLSLLSGGVVRPVLTGSQVSSHSRQRVSSLSSSTSDENDVYATNTDNNASSLFGSRRQAPSPPPFRMEGTMERISLDNIPFPKRHLVFGIKNSEDHKNVQVSSTSGSVVRPDLTGHSRPRFSSESSVSSDDNDYSATNTDRSDKTSNLLGSPSHPPPSPPSQQEGLLKGVSLDDIPLPKRRLIFGVKNTEEVPIISQRPPSLSPISGSIIRPGLTSSHVSSQSRPRLSSQSSLSSDENDNSATITEITGKTTSVSRPPKYMAPPPPIKIEGTMGGVSLDEIPLPKRHIAVGIKNTEDHKEVALTGQRQSSLSSLSGAVVRPGLPGKSRPRLSSQSSVSSDENDNSATITEITGKSSNVSRPPKYRAPPPPIKIEGTMAGVSLGEIPLPKRHIAVGIKNTEDHKEVALTGQKQPGLSSLSGTVVRPGLTGQSRPRLSSQSSVSSEDNDNSAANKKSDLLSQQPPTPQSQREGAIMGDQIPLLKRRLVFGIKNSENHMDVPVTSTPVTVDRPGLTGQSRPRLSSQSSVSSDDNDNSAANKKSDLLSQKPTTPQSQREGAIMGDQIPLLKRRLAFGIKNSEDHMDVPVTSTPVSVVRPGLTGQSRPRLSSQSSVSSDDNDNSTANKKSDLLSQQPPTPQSQREGAIMGDQIPLLKRRLVFGIKNTEDHKEVPLTDQRQPGLSSLSGAIVRPGPSGQSRPRLSSQSSVSSEDNDNSAANKNSDLLSQKPTTPQSQREGAIMGDQIPLLKRRLAFGIKNSEDHMDVPVTSTPVSVVRPDLTGQSRPRLSSQSSVSSDDNDNSTANKKSDLLSQQPPTPQSQREGAIMGDQIPLLKRRLVFGIKNSEDHMDVPVTSTPVTVVRPGLTGQSRPRLSSQSSVSSDDNDNSAANKKSDLLSQKPTTPQSQQEGAIMGDQKPLLKRRLAFGIKNSDDHMDVPVTSTPVSVVRPDLTGQSRPRLSSQSSVSSDDNDNSAANKKSDLLSQKPTTPQSQREGAIMGDQIPLLKRRLVFGIKNSEDHMDVPVTSTPVTVVRPGLTGQSRPRLSSQSSVSSDDNDNSAANKKSDLLSQKPTTPQSQLEGAIMGDQIPLLKRRLAFGIKNSEDHMDVPVTSTPVSVVRPDLTGQSRPRLSSQSSVSSDDNDNSAANKKSDLLSQKPTTPQSQREGAIMGDQIPLLKRRLAFGIKNSDDHMDVPVTSTPVSVVRPDLTGQSRPRLSSQSSVSSDDNDNSTANKKSDLLSQQPPTPQSQREGAIMGDQIPLLKRRLVFGIKNTEDHKEVPLTDQRQPGLSSLSGAIVRPGPSGQSRPRLSSQSSVSSEDNDNSAANKKSDLLSQKPTTPQSQREGAIMGDQIPLLKRRLAFGIKNSEDYMDVPVTSTPVTVVRPGLTGQSRPRLSSQSSVSSDDNDNSTANKKSDLLSQQPPTPQSQREGAIMGDQIPLIKRRLAFGIKNSEDQMDVPVTSTPVTVVRPGLTGQSRPRLSSQSSVSSDDNDNSVSNKKSNLLSQQPPNPQSQREGAIMGDQIPLLKRRLVFGIKNTEDHKEVPLTDQRQPGLSSLSGAVVRPGPTGQSKPRLSSQSSVSSEDNDNSAANKNSDLLSQKPTTPQSQREGAIMGDQIPLLKRRLAFGIKNTEDHMDVPVTSTPVSVVRPDLTGQSRPRLSTQSSVSSDENDNSATITEITGKNSNVSSPPKYTPHTPQVKPEARMSGVSLDKMPLPKRHLAFGIKNSEDHKELPVSSTSGSIRPGLTGGSIVRRSSESSLSSDENDNSATMTEIIDKNTIVSTPDSQPSLNAQPVKKRALLVIRSEDTRVVEKKNAPNQSSENSDENDAEGQLNIPMDRLPQYKRRSVLTSPMDDSLTQKQITPTALQLEPKVPNLNSSYKASVRTDSISDATIMRREQPLKQEVNHRELVSSVFSQDSASPGGVSYKSQNSFAFDHLPKPQKSTLVTSPSFSEMIQKKTANDISPKLGLHQELNQNQDWKTYVPRGRAMDRLSVSSQMSVTSPIPYHSHHTFHNVSTRSVVTTSTTSMSSNVSNVPQRELQFGITDEDGVMFI